MREKVLQRLQKLEQEKEQLKASLAMYEGAIQDCHHWLKELEDGDKPNITEPSKSTE